jgi:ABC-type multidrug transport system ATPase subunit/pSer/pThr/pTyr-binding forkhead associated (FHA) protein
VTSVAKGSGEHDGHKAAHMTQIEATSGTVAIEVVCGATSRVFEPGALVVLGRARDVTIPIDDPGVSSRHLMLEHGPAGWVARDMGSTNGSFLDGVAFTDTALDREWSTLLLGGTDDGVVVRVRTIAPDPDPYRTQSAPPAGSSAIAPFAAPTPLAPPRPLVTPPLPLVTPGGVQGGGETRAWKSRRQLKGGAVVREVVIGRDETCDVVVDDLLVSRQHARVEFLDDGTTRIVDLRSVNGTFVDQRLAEPAIELAEGSVVSIGNADFVFTGGQLRRVVETDGAGSAGFAVLGLTVPDRLDHVSFALPPKSFLAVLGTSGAGKSTLLKAITGIEPATAGSVRFDDRDLYANFRALRHRIGYVPQDDILHDQLTVDESLGFGAELRFPDASPADRQARIDEVITDLGLQAHRSKLVRQLSGGQRKRVSVGLELLHRPSLLILDEPTSGLDPGNERRLMTQLARLARSDSGRTVLVVTHSTESLHLCDQVLFLAKGGITIYMGPPQYAAETLGAADFPDAFAFAEETADPEAMRDRFLASPFGAPIRAMQAMALPVPAVASSQSTATAKSTFARDLRIFVRRYVRLITADRKALWTIGLQAPIIAGMVAIASASGTLDRVVPKPGAGNVLMALVLGSIYAGASNAAREVVKERSILRREQNFGISLAAYLLSKMIVLSAISVLQAIVFVVVGTARQGTLGDPSLLGSAKFELFLVVALSGISAVALGLLLSCVVSSSDKASGILPMLLLAQFVLAGLSFSVSKLGVQQISWLMSARWGFAAAASTVDYEALGGCDPNPIPAAAVRPACLGSWGHGAGVWFGDMFALVVLTALFLSIAWVLLMRSDPANSLGEDEPDLPQWKRMLGIR